MIRLIRNEWVKTRREWALWLALLLHLAPLGMVVTAALMGAISSDPVQRYFVIHNQSMLVTGIVAGVVTTLAFQVELANRTWFDWLVLPAGPVRLVAAKLLLVWLVLGAFLLVSTAVIAAFLLASGAGDGTWRLVAGHLVMQTGIWVFMSLLAALLCLLTRNVVLVNVVVVGLTLVTIVLMPAEFAWALPTAWPYRAGLVVVDPEYGFEWAAALPLGAAVMAGAVALLATAVCLAARQPRVINAARQ